MKILPLANNETVPMTRRYPDLPRKVLIRDSNIIKKIIQANEKPYANDQDRERVLSIFLKEQNQLSDQRFWETMRSVWIICGSNSNADVFRKLMQSKRKHSYYFSTPEDAKKLREMPETFEVYRAGSDSDNGLSWTISPEYAEYYLKTFKKEKIITRTVNKNDVFAFIQRNLESEIIIL